MSHSLCVRAFVAALLLVLGTADSARAQANCSIVSQNLFVRDVLQDLYLWRTELPNPDPATFDSPESYLEAVRFRPLDNSFSYIASRAETEALFSNSEYVGFGFSSAWRGDDMWIAQVFPGSSAEEVGLRRGDRIVTINGRTVAQLVESGEIDDAWGPSEAGVTRNVTFQRGDATLGGRMTKRAVIIPTVSDSRVIEVEGRRIGYVFFRNFVEPSAAALDAAFADLKRQGATELVLDVRYNGGGLVSVAQHLGGLIGGSLTSGQVFAQYSHNDRNAFRNRTLRFPVPENALQLNRVFVVTTRASASASELVINALRPFMPVVVIGDRTYGKPVGQYQVPFCDRILAPVSFTLRNADNQGDFFDGIAPTCVAGDDLTSPIGNPAEASLAEAIHFVRAGACSTRSTQLRSARRADERTPVGGWQSIVGAN